MSMIEVSSRRWSETTHPELDEVWSSPKDRGTADHDATAQRERSRPKVQRREERDV